jgi:transcriptional regulator with XRE-family HTH domain
MHGQAAITLPVRGLPKAGIDSKYVQDIERGEANPTLAMLVAIAQALDLTLAELLEGV